MKTRNKIITTVLLATAAAAGTSLINKIIKIKATSENLLDDHSLLSFNWRLGKIRYAKIGTGAPLLLIHDLDSAASGYEWNCIVEELSKQYTLYIPDLIGCGRSEKPDITYTNFLYVQMISDFIRSEIKHRTAVVVTGNSVPPTIMACKTNPELFSDLIFIAPQNPSEGLKFPGKRAKTYKLIFNLPIIGTLLYNIASSKHNLAKRFGLKNFYDSYSISDQFFDTYYESSHLGVSPKSLYGSLICNYIKCNFTNALSDLDHSMFIISGSSDYNSTDIAKAYQKINSSIETTVIECSKKLPQIEAPDDLINTINIFLS